MKHLKKILKRITSGSLGIKELPYNLKVGGDLDLGNTAIKWLPDDLKIEGDLDLGNTAMKWLPDDLTDKHNTHQNL